MPNKVKEHCRASLLSCERYTELASRSLEEPLQFREKIQFWAHHALCLVCRRFRRQLLFLEKATAKYELSMSTDCEEKQSSLGAKEIQLTAQARQKIQSAISQSEQNN